MKMKITSDNYDELKKLMRKNSYAKVCPGGEYAAIFDALLEKYRGDDTRLAMAAFQMGYECRRMEQKGGKA